MYHIKPSPWTKTLHFKRRSAPKGAGDLGRGPSGLMICWWCRNLRFMNGYMIYDVWYMIYDIWYIYIYMCVLQRRGIHEHRVRPKLQAQGGFSVVPQTSQWGRGAGWELISSVAWGSSLSSPASLVDRRLNGDWAFWAGLAGPFSGVGWQQLWLAGPLFVGGLAVCER